VQKIISLLDSMEDGREYASIVGKMPDHFDLVQELQRGLKEISGTRGGRPCLLYVGNVPKGSADSAIIAKDDLPFMEMIRTVPKEHRAVDVFLATNGGSGAQVARFVNALRARFDEVDFLLPANCMSAGTLFALSGDHIWMTPDACLGPIDPQVPNHAGRFVPAQALVLLVEKLQKDGQEALRRQQPVPWTAVRLIDSIDKKDLGDAITASAYSVSLATEFLTRYKFRQWKIRSSSQILVDDHYRKDRATVIANALASHERWKSHGHSIARDVLWDEIQLMIDHPDVALERAIRRTWALCYWTFDRTQIQKLIVADNFSYLTIADPGAKT
jgi:hypothetical protein